MIFDGECIRNKDWRKRCNIEYYTEKDIALMMGVIDNIVDLRVLNQIQYLMHRMLGHVINIQEIELEFHSEFGCN